MSHFQFWYAVQRYNGIISLIPVYLTICFAGLAIVVCIAAAAFTFVNTYQVVAEWWRGPATIYVLSLFICEQYTCSTHNNVLVMCIYNVWVNNIILYFPIFICLYSATFAGVAVGIFFDFFLYEVCSGEQIVRQPHPTIDLMYTSTARLHYSAFLFFAGVLNETIYGKSAYVMHSCL